MSGAIQATKIIAGLTAVELVHVTDEAAGRGDGRITYEILNNGTATLYIDGANTVTTATGSPIPAGGARTLNLRLGAKVWGISTSATQDIRILKVG
jgi:hypothetical protein